MRTNESKPSQARHRSCLNEHSYMINPDETLLLRLSQHRAPSTVYEFYQVMDQALDQLRQQPNDEHLREMVISEAYLIARHHLPPGIADQLGVPDGQIYQHMDEGTPTLRAALILLRSYDATGSDRIREIVEYMLEYMLDTTNSSFVEALHVAYVEALASKQPRPIHETFMRRSTTIDDKNDGCVTLPPDSGVISLVPDTAEMPVMA